MSTVAARALTWGTALASVCGLIWLFVGWLELEPASLSHGLQPDIALQQVTLTRYSQEGQRQWSLSAQTIAIDEASRTTVAEAVEVGFWQAGQRGGQANETLVLSVEAQRLVLDNVRQDMVFAGTLSAKDDQGLSFVTRDATWHQQEQALEGEELVQVRRGDLFLEGRGFRYDVKSGKFLLKEQARLRWVPGEGP